MITFYLISYVIIFNSLAINFFARSTFAYKLNEQAFNFDCHDEGNPPGTSPIDPTQPANRDIRFGSYLPNWYVYNKHYMGIDKMNVDGTIADPHSATSQYNFWAKNMEKLAPKLTSIYYAFWKLNKDCAVEDIDSDASWYGVGEAPVWIQVPQGACKGVMNDLMSLKHQFPHLKIMVSLGGWNHSGYFSECSKNQEMRARIATTLDFLLNQMDPDWGKPGGIWDGVDLDWEFPEASGATNNFSNEDWTNYVLLIKEIRQLAQSKGRTNAMITSAIGVGVTLDQLISKPHVATEFCESLDYVNMMTYDIHGGWSGTTGHNAPFCVDPRAGNPMNLSVVDVVNRFISAGCEPQKINLGIPNYSQAWTNIEPGQHGNGLFSTATTNSWRGWSTFSDSDNSLQSQGILSYWDVANDKFNHADLQEYIYTCPANHDVVVPIKHLYSASRKAFATFEDIETVEHKAIWAKTRGLGGIFFWDAQQDGAGVLLDAARSGFGITETHPAQQAAKCFDERKINYSLDPITGQPVKTYCQFTNHSITFRSGDTCNGLRAVAVTTCKDHDPTVIGGHRQNSTECLQICGPKFDAGNVTPWVGDVIYYACGNELIPDAESPPEPQTTTPQPQIKSDDCTTCDVCVAIPGNIAAANDAACSPCARGKQPWWPCNVVGLCRCA